MSFHIPEDTLRSIREAVNIRQIVGEYVALKKSGRSWMGLCPFHSDSDPSFSVNEDKQIFYCFGCGDGGDVFSFLMKMQGMSFVEAVKALADRCGITVPEKPRSLGEKRRRAEKDFLATLNEEAAGFYHHNLLNSRSASRAREYLAKRGLDQEIISRFRLGWAPDRWDSLIRHFEARSLSLAKLEKSGLVVARKEGTGFYDRFRNRVMFPITDHSGRVVALGGRLLEDGLPKYMNSPETAVYQKGRILYGFHQNKGAIRKADKGFVVEGYMDLLSLAVGGVANVVATLGTALTGDHALRMKSLCRDWILVFDGDTAGRKAALRSLPLFYRSDLRVRVMSLPAGDDPDTFIRREGRDAWDRSAEKAQSGLDFAVEQGFVVHGKDLEARSRILEDILPILESVRDPVRKSLLLGHVAQKLGAREESLWQRLKADQRGRRAKSSQMWRSSSSENPLLKDCTGPRLAANSADSKVIGFLLAHPQHLAGFLDAGLDLWLQDVPLKELWRTMVHLYSAEGSLKLSGLLGRLDSLPEVKALAVRLAADFPPCEDSDNFLEGLKIYCETQRKKALRMLLLDQIRTESKDGCDEKLLRKIQELR